MKTIRPGIALIGCLLSLLTACNQNRIVSPSMPAETPAPPAATLTEVYAPTPSVTSLSILEPEQEATPMAPPTASASLTGLEPLIESAKEDLAQRLSIAGTEIRLVEIVEAEWSDSSLDCPQPGMDYLQVITPGYRILLEANATVYEYHSNRDGYVVYCESTVPPVLPPKP